MQNYFNYFTEIEECFRRCRGTPTLLSTLDWALIESWKESGFPLPAVLVGIERSFEKFARRPQRFRKVNSLTYCTQEVLRAAEEARTAEIQSGGRPGGGLPAPAFAPEEILAFLNHNAGALEAARQAAKEAGSLALVEDLDSSARLLRDWAGPRLAGADADLQELEIRLSALEDKLTASLTRAASLELLAQCRREIERGLVAYRRKLSAAQIESLERQFLKKRLFEHYRIPRLSLFYL